MDIILRNVGKKYNKTWIFRNFSHRFSAGHSYAIVGSNGSGKSTLMQIIAGYLLPTTGSIEYLAPQHTKTPPHSFFRWYTLVAPYMELIEELTLQEFIKFHFRFKKLQDDLSWQDVIHFLSWEDASEKMLKHFSSGMKQKLQLGLAFLTDVPIVLLDEPTANLDASNIEWYLQQIEKVKSKKLIITFSNQPHEYTFCNQVVDLESYK
ncbi:MAG: ATP-binding cassette domain-containing protein [Cytophagales bacterium]|nr:ATP-binding cassette domain-containing protein [Cytophagales bacterium]